MAATSGLEWEVSDEVAATAEVINRKNYTTFKIAPAEMNKCARPSIVETNYSGMTRADLVDSIEREKDREAACGKVGIGMTRFGSYRALQEGLDVLDKFLPLEEGQVYP